MIKIVSFMKMKVIFQISQKQVLKENYKLNHIQMGFNESSQHNT